MRAFLFLLFAWTATGQNAGGLKSEQHQFRIRNFKTESGVTLPEAVVVYGTYGHLNASKDNVVLLPSYFRSNYHGYERMIGQGKALNPEDVLIVATELFGNGRSSSPAIRRNLFTAHVFR